MPCASLYITSGIDATKKNIAKLPVLLKAATLLSAQSCKYLKCTCKHLLLGSSFTLNLQDFEGFDNLNSLAYVFTKSSTFKEARKEPFDWLERLLCNLQLALLRSDVLIGVGWAVMYRKQWYIQSFWFGGQKFEFKKLSTAFRAYILPKYETRRRLLKVYEKSICLFHI